MGVLLSLSTVKPMTGRIEGFIFSTWICTSAGSWFLICAIRDSIICWFTSILAFQLRNAEISHVPRLVVLLKSLRSGTILIASSSGLVTVTIIFSTGCSPLSAIILSFGNVISGNNETWILPYRKSPPAIITAMITEIGFL